MNKKRLNKLYIVGDFTLTFFWILLFILSLVGFIDINQSPFKIIDSLILILFTLIYIIRFANADNKKKYFLSNIFDLLAIIPLNLFSTGVLASSNRLFRVINLLGKLGHKKNSVFYRNGFIYALYASSCIIFVGSGFHSIAEGKSYGKVFGGVLLR